MKKLFGLLMMMAMAIACVTSFTACSGDDEYEMTDGGDDGMTVGTHRIDVTFEGMTAGWEASVSFSGTSPVTTEGSSLYENGERLRTAQGVWLGEGIRNYSVSSDDRTQYFFTMIVLRQKSHAVVQPVTIHFRGFVNGRQKRTKTVVVDGSHAVTNIIFNSENADRDQEIEVDC